MSSSEVDDRPSAGRAARQRRVRLDRPATRPICTAPPRSWCASGEAARVSDEALAQIITAAVRLYYAKSELEDRAVPAIVQEGAETLTPTEMLVAVSEMLRDVRLGPMELGLWFRRRPGENLPDGDGRNRLQSDVARSKP